MPTTIPHCDSTFVLSEFITNSDTRSNFELEQAILKAGRIDKTISSTSIAFSCTNFVPYLAHDMSLYKKHEIHQCDSLNYSLLMTPFKDYGTSPGWMISSKIFRSFWRGSQQIGLLSTFSTIKVYSGHSHLGAFGDQQTDGRKGGEWQSDPFIFYFFSIQIAESFERELLVKALA